MRFEGMIIMISEIALLALVFISIYLFIFWTLVIFKYRKEFKKRPFLRGNPGITIIIPAFNAEDTIEKAVQSCLDQDYPVNVIVVDDGSSDGTYGKLKKFGKRIKVIRKSNSGKADSLNTALKSVKTEFFGCLDADSWFVNRDAVRNALAMFGSDVGAVTPCMFARKGDSLIERIQWFEYLMSIYLRKLMAFLNIIYVTPGPGSIYRTRLVKRLGGFSTESLVEDTDIALKIQKAGYRIENSLHSMVETDVPKTFLGLVKQRMRWYTGYLETILFSHPDLIFDRRNPHLGVFLIPTNFAVQGLIIYSFFFSIKLLIKSALDALKRFSILGMDIFSTIELPKITFNIGFMAGFVLLSFLFSLLFILAIRSFMPKRVKTGTRTYAEYLLLYMPLLYIFFSLSFVYLLKRILAKEIRSDKGWRATKVR